MLIQISSIDIEYNICSCYGLMNVVIYKINDVANYKTALHAMM